LHSFQGRYSSTDFGSGRLVEQDTPTCTCIAGIRAGAASASTQAAAPPASRSSGTAPTRPAASMPAQSALGGLLLAAAALLLASGATAAAAVQLPSCGRGAPSGAPPCVPTWEPTYDMGRSTVFMPCNVSGYTDPAVYKGFGLVDFDCEACRKQRAPLSLSYADSCLVCVCMCVLCACMWQGLTPKVRGARRRPWIAKSGWCIKRRSPRPAAAKTPRSLSIGATIPSATGHCRHLIISASELTPCSAQQLGQGTAVVQLRAREDY
jgi:hypothetical protein